jgi:membrane-associated phospholipid phosphatase
MHRRWRRSLAGLTFVLALAGAGVAQADSGGPPSGEPAMAPGADAAIVWNRELLSIVRTPGAQPATLQPTRSFALLHVAIYDAVEAIDRRYALYGITADAPSAASPAAAADQAAHDVLVALYPSMTPQIDQQLAGALATVPDGPRKQAGVGVGADVARKVLALRAADGSGATPPTYTSTGAPGDYQPAAAQPVFTHWGAVTPWVIRSADQFPVAPPPALTSTAYADSINQIESVGRNTSTTRTDDQTQAARFWGAPIQNYWNEITQNQAMLHHYGLERDARLFAQVNLAFADSTIAFYKAKYQYRLWRPVTAIHNAADDGNLQTTPDPTWTPLLATPNDPSYPGAHSVISAAGATILRGWFGDDVSLTVTSEALPNVQRHFDSFSAAVREAGQSRTWAGVHTSLDDAAGQALGAQIGGYVGEHALGRVHHSRRAQHAHGKAHRRH